MIQFLWSKVRLWSVRFREIRPLETLPEPYEIVYERQTSPRYRHEGRGRPPDYAQIVCTIKGEGAFRLGDRIFPLTPGTAFASVVGDPETAYYYPPHAREPWEFLWVSFAGKTAADMLQELNRRHGYVFRLPLDSGLVPHLSSYRTLRHSIRFVTPLEGAKIVMDILAELGKNIENGENLSRANSLVRTAQELIVFRLADPGFDLAAVAEKLNVSREHLSRVFTSATGMTPGAFATEERMKLALRLLGDKGASCKEVALRVGFTSPSSFARAFRHYYGKTPSEAFR